MKKISADSKETIDGQVAKLYVMPRHYRQYHFESNFTDTPELIATLSPTKQYSIGRGFSDRNAGVDIDLTRILDILPPDNEGNIVDKRLYVSRNHGEFFYEKGSWHFKDNNSKHGTVIEPYIDEEMANERLMIRYRQVVIHQNKITSREIDARRYYDEFSEINRINPFNVCIDSLKSDSEVNLDDSRSAIYPIEHNFAELLIYLAPRFVLEPYQYSGYSSEIDASKGVVLKFSQRNN